MTVARDMSYRKRPQAGPSVRWRLRLLGSSLRLEKCECLFARITNSMKGADDADAREHDYEDEHNEQPEGLLHE